VLPVLLGYAGSIRAISGYFKASVDGTSYAIPLNIVDGNYHTEK